MARRRAEDMPVYAPKGTIEDALEAVQAALRAHKDRQHCETTARLQQAHAALQMLKGGADRKVIADAKEGREAAREFVQAKKAQAAAEVREKLADERRQLHDLIAGLCATSRSGFTDVQAVRQAANSSLGLYGGQVDAHLLELDRQFKIDLKVPNDWKDSHPMYGLNVPNRGACWFVLDRGGE